MKAKILIGLALAAVGAIYMYLVYPLVHSPEVVQNAVPLSKNLIKPAKEKKVCFDKECFLIQVADTPETRELGLMNKGSLDIHAGMLFVFDSPDIYGFWMKNTLIPLDIVWLDKDFTVVDTATMTPCTADPCPTYDPQSPASYALEINAGLVEKYAIKIGDIATH